MKAVRAAQSRDVSVRGGKTAGNLHAVNRTGVCGQTKEELLKNASEGGRIGGPLGAANPASIKALYALTQDRRHQQYAAHCARHVKKGIKNLCCEFCRQSAGAENGN
jgi:hypothetical protein